MWKDGLCEVEVDMVVISSCFAQREDLCSRCR